MSKGSMAPVEPGFLLEKHTIGQLYVFYMRQDDAFMLLAKVRNLSEEDRLTMNEARAKQNLPPIPPRIPKL